MTKKCKKCKERHIFIGLLVIALIASFVAWAITMYQYNVLCNTFNDLVVVTNKATTILNTHTSIDYQKIGELSCFKLIA